MLSGMARTKVWIGMGGLALAAAVVGVYPRLGRQADGSYLIPTGQRLTPAGLHVEVNDRPLGLALSPDGGRLAVVTGSNFAPRALHLIDAAEGRVTATVPLGNSFVGVAFSGDGQRLYVGGGASNEVRMFRVGGAAVEEAGAVKLAGAAPSGLCVSPDGKTLWVALNLKHAVAAIDLETKEAREIAVGMHPYTAACSADGEKVYVTNWAGRRARGGDTTDELFSIVVDPRTGIPNTGTVSVIDARRRAVIGEIEVGLHPSGMALSPDGGRLYVANANSDTVSVIDTRTDTVVESIHVAPGKKAPLGSSPNALAVSGDGKTLYVANGANNAVAFVDLSGGEPRVAGFVPTGWYPAAVAAGKDGKAVWVASGYGFGSVAAAKGEGRSYKDRAGVVSRIENPKAAQLAAFTKQVEANNRLVSSGGKRAAGNPVPMHLGEASPIRHVFYIIKENRTYDQVLGDVAQGNGDARLVQFGREVTPNHHALVEEFVLLDNFYTPADQSALGHRWCTQGYVSDWLFKYSNGRNDANPMLYAPTEFLWDNAKRQGLTVRSYGERGTNRITPAKAAWKEIYDGWRAGKMTVDIQPKTFIPGLKDIYHPRYPAFGGVVPDQYRAELFLEEFREFEKNGNLPRLTILLLPNDHTNAKSPGLPTPRAAVADNDLALGRIVEAISRSRYWQESAIFVVEDDAQDGVDHVAGHRTVAMVIGPWVKRRTVDSRFYTTINLYRTMEQILGLPPQNQFDVAAEPMFACFTAKPDAAPYKTLPNRVPLDELNPQLKELRGQEREDALASLRMNLSEPDAAPEEELNHIVWRATRGRAPYPRREGEDQDSEAGLSSSRRRSR